MLLEILHNSYILTVLISLLCIQLLVVNPTSPENYTFSVVYIFSCNFDVYSPSSSRDSTDSVDPSHSAGGLVGSLTDTNISPLLFSTRLLCHSFLLTGYEDGETEPLYPDRDIRVSIKSLALSCLSHIVLYFPQSFSKPMFVEETGKYLHVSLYHFI